VPVGLGILGFAHAHVGAYCRRWREDPALDVATVAGWDHDAERLAGAVAQHGVAACETPAALLARPDVDAVLVAAETVRHADLVEQAAAAGKAVVLQKPMALTLEEADRIIAAVEKAGVPFTMAWQMRVDPQNLAMKRLLADGTLGRVLMVRRRHGLAIHRSPALLHSWYLDPDLNRDIWADDASHPVDFVYWLLGMPSSVTAEITSMAEPPITSANGVAVYRYGDGPLAVVSCSFACAAGENTTEIIGDRGVAIQNYGDAPSANVPRPAGAAGLKWYLADAGEWTQCDIPSPASHGERIAGLAGPLADFLRGARGPIATAAEGRDALRMVLACYDSAASGRRVML